MINRIKTKIEWFRLCDNRIGYKFLVILGIKKSPSLEHLIKTNQVRNILDEINKGISKSITS